MNLIRKHPKGVLVFNTAMCAICIVLGILGLVENIRIGNYGVACSDAFLILSLIFALLYMAMGHNKKSAPIFKAAIYAFLISTLISIIVNVIITPAESAGSLISTVLISLIGFCLVAAVAFVPNLGEKLSLRFAAVNLIMRGLIFVIVALLMIVSPHARETQSIAVIYRTISLTVLSAIIYVNTCYKYIDKEARGTE